MERRDVLKVGALGVASATVGAAGAAGAGCATVPHAGGAVGLPDDGPAGAEFLAALDHQLGYLGHARIADEMVTATRGPSRSAGAQSVIDRNDEAVRRMLRTLTITQNFRDLPVETQIEPAVQARMAGHMDEVDATVFEVSDRLAALGPDHHAKVQKALRDQPDLAMQIGEMIDARAAQAGMSRSRRNQLRTMMMQTAFRLKHEGPGALIDEYTEKVTRLREEGDRSALALALSERIGNHAFWAHQKQVAQAPGATPPPPPPPPGTMPAPPPPGAMQPVAYPAPVQVQSSRDGRFMRIGGVMMGVGVVIAGVSALLVGSGTEVFLIGITVGAVLFVIGLIFLIVGAIMAAVD